MNVTNNSTSQTSFSELYNPTGKTSARSAKKTLDQSDFMKLLSVQFQQQDPMKPMEDTAFIAQMAQFNSLEQSSAMLSQITQLRADQQNLMAQNYLGQIVTVENATGQPVTGLVEALETNPNDGRQSLSIGGSLYSLSSVRRIEPAVIFQPTTIAVDGNAPAA